MFLHPQTPDTQVTIVISFSGKGVRRKPAALTDKHSNKFVKCLFTGAGGRKVAWTSGIYLNEKSSGVCLELSFEFFCPRGLNISVLTPPYIAIVMPRPMAHNPAPAEMQSALWISIKNVVLGILNCSSETMQGGNESPEFSHLTDS